MLVALVDKRVRYFISTVVAYLYLRCLSAHFAWESGGGSPSGGSPNGAEVERAKSAETVSKFGLTLGAPLAIWGKK